jgi:hypothetical protein
VAEVHAVAIPHIGEAVESQRRRWNWHSSSGLPAQNRASNKCRPVSGGFRARGKLKGKNRNTTGPQHHNAAPPNACLIFSAHGVFLCGLSRILSKKSGPLDEPDSGFRLWFPAQSVRLFGFRDFRATAFFSRSEVSLVKFRGDRALHCLDGLFAILVL